MSKSPAPYIVQDEYFKKAKALGYRARSAFKLIEIDDSLKIIKTGMHVLDLAAAPGSWLQVLSQRVGPHGIVIGGDLQEIKPLHRENVKTFVGDVFQSENVLKIARSYGVEKFDLITSDIAPATSGISDVDQYRSMELNLAILTLAKVLLKKHSDLILKVFIGEDTHELIRACKDQFYEFRRMKPKACRARSFEEYFICRKMK